MNLQINLLINESLYKLKKYCENELFMGWDPYDGLNSLIFKYSPLKFSKLLRLAWIQSFKKNPINLRPLFLVRRGYNPKGLSLFLSAYCNLYNINQKEDYIHERYHTCGWLRKPVVPHHQRG